MSEVEKIIFSVGQIRKQAKRIFNLTIEDKTHFKYHPELLTKTSEYVVSVIKENYPDLKIPFHCRENHFKCSQRNRNEEFQQLSPQSSNGQRVKAKVDLIITSVLLDAGAGKDWSFNEDQRTYSRSEGLAIASYHMFINGGFSSDENKLKADAKKLLSISSEHIESGFQVNQMNPLVGTQGRAKLLNKLGDCLNEFPQVFTNLRPSDLLEFLKKEHGTKIKAVDILGFVLKYFGGIWPGRLEAEGKNLGDTWEYAKLKNNEEFSNLVPFHKLSQWLTYSLINPIEDFGIEVIDVHEMTGLPEYRNGGLLLDSGLISLKDQSLLEQSHLPTSELIIEWRALTVHILDSIANEVRSILTLSEQEFPLAKVLEGGTWWAGRKLAKEKRAGGVPPLKLQSDGTVF